MQFFKVYYAYVHLVLFRIFYFRVDLTILRSKISYVRLRKLWTCYHIIKHKSVLYRIEFCFWTGLQSNSKCRYTNPASHKYLHRVTKSVNKWLNLHGDLCMESDQGEKYIYQRIMKHKDHAFIWTWLFYIPLNPLYQFENEVKDATHFPLVSWHLMLHLFKFLFGTDQRIDNINLGIDVSGFLISILSQSSGTVQAFSATPNMVDHIEIVCGVMASQTGNFGFSKFSLWKITVWAEFSQTGAYCVKHGLHYYVSYRDSVRVNGAPILVGSNFPFRQISFKSERKDKHRFIQI